MNVQYLKRENKPTLAYIHTPPTEQGESLPTVMFLGGYRSDMNGTKAAYLEAQCAARGQGYVRFDYSGHGSSDGAFTDGTIGSWKDDATAILDQVVQRHAILVGSSMGGWMALLVARARSAQIVGLVGIAAAPDFTEEIYNRLNESQKRTLNETGKISVPNDYNDEPYHYTKAFYDEAKEHLLMGEPRNTTFPLRIIQGKEDKDVPWETAVKINEVFQHEKSDVILIDDGDHRLSRPQDLEIIDREIKILSAL